MCITAIVHETHKKIYIFWLDNIPKRYVNLENLAVFSFFSRAKELKGFSEVTGSQHNGQWRKIFFLKICKCVAAVCSFVIFAL